MAQMEIKRFPDPLLRKKGEDVKSIGNDEKRVLSDMAETMYLKGGVGLAAEKHDLGRVLAAAQDLRFVVAFGGLSLCAGRCSGQHRHGGHKPHEFISFHPVTLINRSKAA